MSFAIPGLPFVDICKIIMRGIYMAYHNFNMRSGTPVFPINTDGGAKQACMRTTQAQRALQIGGSHLIPLPAM